MNGDVKFIQGQFYTEVNGQWHPIQLPASRGGRGAKGNTGASGTANTFDIWSTPANIEYFGVGVPADSFTSPFSNIFDTTENNVKYKNNTTLKLQASNLQIKVFEDTLNNSAEVEVMINSVASGLKVIIPQGSSAGDIIEDNINSTTINNGDFISFRVTSPATSGKVHLSYLTIKVIIL